VDRSQVHTDEAPGYISWMAQGIRVGDLLFTGGSIPRHPKTLEIPSSFEEQCRVVFDNLEAVLRAGGSSLQTAVKVNIYLTDMQNWEAMNDFYKQYIDEAAPPARTTVQVAGLNNNYQIEVEAVALCQ
jgi:2-iminobutanoate/2-iminopropanoate deaminase